MYYHIILYHIIVVLEDALGLLEAGDLVVARALALLVGGVARDAGRLQVLEVHVCICMYIYIYICVDV